MIDEGKVRSLPHHYSFSVAFLTKDVDNIEQVLSLTVCYRIGLQPK